VRTYLRVQC